MDSGLQTWLVTFVVITAVAVVTQLGILTALFLGVRRMQAKIEVMLDRDVQPLLANAHDLVAESRKAVDKLNGAADDVVGFTHNQAGRFDQLLAEAVDRARLQLIRADDLISDALDRVEKTTEQVQKSVTGPIREMESVLSGIRTALDVLLGRRRPMGPVERSSQDEEMFI